MMPLFIQAATLIAAVIILTRSEPVLNRMSKDTPFFIRLSIVLLAVGAAAEIGCILFLGEKPSWATAIIINGIAALMIYDRRLRNAFRVEREELS